VFVLGCDIRAGFPLIPGALLIPALAAAAVSTTSAAAVSSTSTAAVSSIATAAILLIITLISLVLGYTTMSELSSIRDERSMPTFTLRPLFVDEIELFH
jgi:hypothetical protein